ncbi:hypothetical protein [Actinoplanes sp. ATCC 53533]|nr:hypothetical protein [Actinoplanes sp. ATCC 53533]
MHWLIHTTGDLLQLVAAAITLTTLVADRTRKHDTGSSDDE